MKTNASSSGNSPSIQELVDLMDMLLNSTTGLDSFQRQEIIYYVFATHALGSLESFPVLTIKGPTATGKSSTMKVIAKFAYNPNAFPIKKMTMAVVRDKLIESSEHPRGTAIIEEGDQMWKGQDELESLLSDRCMKSTARLAIKVPDGNGGWKTEEHSCFGATIIHRRTSYKDAALDGRSVLIRFHAISNRPFSQLEHILGEETVDLGSLKNLVLPDVPVMPGVVGRVFDTYRPILAVAGILEDKEFTNQMKKHLKLETIQLKEAQSYEPDGLVLRALLYHISKPSPMDPNQSVIDLTRNIRVLDVARTIQDTENVPMSPRQVAAFLRDFGFEMGNRSGATIVIPRSVPLLRACEQCQYTDPAIEALRKKVLEECES